MICVGNAVRCTAPRDAACPTFDRWGDSAPVISCLDCDASRRRLQRGDTARCYVCLKSVDACNAQLQTWGDDVASICVHGTLSYFSRMGVREAVRRDDTLTTPTLSVRGPWVEACRVSLLWCPASSPIAVDTTDTAATQQRAAFGVWVTGAVDWRQDCAHCHVGEYTR